MLGSYGLRASTSMVTMALSSAATAVMLDDESAQARTSLAHAKARAQWNWHEAELEFQRAIRLDPGYATSHHWYARCCLVPMGRLDEARDEVLLRAIARSGVVDHRARSRVDSLLPARLRQRAGPLRSGHRAQSALPARLFHPQPRAGEARRHGRGARRAAARRAARAQKPADDRVARPRAGDGRPSRRCAEEPGGTEGSRTDAVRVVLGARDDLSWA